MTLQLNGRITVDGAPREGSYIRVNGPSGDFVWEARTDQDGSFRFNLPEGTWTVIAFGPGTEKKTQQYSLAADSDPLNIDLRSA